MKKRLVIYGVILSAVVGGICWLNADSSANLGEVFGKMVLVLVLLGIGLALYFAPTIQAHQNKKKQTTAIFCLNFFLGWTILGWVGAMVWAVTKD
jgi:hypothetical protein